MTATRLVATAWAWSRPHSLTYSMLGGIVFVAVAWVPTNEIRFADILLALAAGHVYMTIASGSPWLLSSRGNVLVAMPFVVLATWLGSQLLSHGLASRSSRVFWRTRARDLLDQRED